MTKPVLQKFPFTHFAKESTLKNLLYLGVLAFGLLPCLGCNDAPPPSTEAEAQKLNESPDYEKEMMGETSGGGETSGEGDTSSE